MLNFRITTRRKNVSEYLHPIRYLVVLLCTMVITRSFAQQQKQAPDHTTLVSEIIIGIKPQGEEGTTKAVLKMIGQGTTGLGYLAYCTSQHALILTYASDHFTSAADVVAYLRSTLGARILGVKEQSVRDFYRICDFKNESEYQYFKKTYQ